MAASNSVAAVVGIEKVSQEFLDLVCAMAGRLGTHPDWHLAVMANESGFSPSITNSIGATGLIQFIPSTAKRLGTTTDELRGMSREEQLFWVEKYYAPFAGRMHDVEDVYMATFMPAHVGRGSDNIIAVKGQKVYDQNASLDRNKDGVLTNGDVGSVVRGHLAKAQSKPRIPVNCDATFGGGSSDESPFSKGRSPRWGSGPDSNSGGTSPGVDEAALERIIPSINVDIGDDDHE